MRLVVCVGVDTHKSESIATFGLESKNFFGRRMTRGGVKGLDEAPWIWCNGWAVCEALEDDVDEASRDNDDFAGRFAFEKGEDLWIVACEVFEGSGSDIVGDIDFGAEFPVDLDNNGDGFIDNKGGIVGGPRLISEGVWMTEEAPDLFGDVGAYRGE